MKSRSDLTRKRVAGLALALTCALVAAMVIASPAEAFGRTCGTPILGPHCYSISQSGNSTPFAAMELLANQAPMDAGYSTAVDQWFATSEMWLCQTDSCSRWFETGFLNGYVPVYGAGAYVVFNSYFDTGDNFHINYRNAMGAANNAGHQFRIGRAASPFSFSVSFDYRLTDIWSTSFWAGSYAQFGGEMATRSPRPVGFPTPFASTFQMNGAVQTMDGAWHGMPQPSGHVSPGMNGVSYSAGEWSWNAP